MRAADLPKATGAALSIAADLGLAADDAVVLQNSNKASLRLLPCDVLARVAPVQDGIAQFEIDVAQRLTEAGSPIAALDPRVEPRVYERTGYAVTFWTFHETVTGDEIAPADYADALHELHRAMRTIEVRTPHFTDRVAQAQHLVENRDLTPELAEADRQLLDSVLRRPVRGTDQLLHGEPHPGNVLKSKGGLLFIDLETCCRGPVEFDLAHAPEEVGERYPGVDRGLLKECRVLVLAMITTWRWDREDQLPDGRRLGMQWLAEIRAYEGWQSPGSAVGSG
ncbi:phosphotransferase [Winogradskya humida]|uniref:Aminoglycoside phosphotransferase n=1 Tax=Winogradskya humida TaxID=113566 RepID=A0ABQ3ZUB8_9ACTN|nr:phosphotransferase [Actinoplanes humidus]GIE22168.1 aminoglycoside phosphotransferase [Actinoplanes humidus]